MTPDIFKLFAEKPLTWGLRGDPYLWEAMKSCSQHLPLPVSANAMEDLLKACFCRLVGEALQPGSKTYQASFDHGGLSGGL
jgi:molybdenum cofactor cytidylyltransferase